MGSIIPNVPVTQYLVSSPSTDLDKTPHGYKAACAFEAMPFLAFWFVPYLSYSVPWCFFRSWHSPLVQFHWVIPRWVSPNGALCLIHPWLPVLSRSLWKQQCWSYPPRVTLLGGGGSAQLAGSLTSTEPHLPEGAEPGLLSLHPTQIHAHWILLLDLGWRCDVAAFFTCLTSHFEHASEHIEDGINVDYSHTRGLNCVHGNEWMGFWWLSQGG